MYWKSISFTLLSLGAACVPLLGDDDPQVTVPPPHSVPGVRWVEKEIKIRTLVPVFDAGQASKSADQIQLPSRLPAGEIDPMAMQRRMLEWVRQSAGQPRPFRLVDLADEGSIKSKDVLLYELPGQRMVLRHLSFTIGGIPHLDVVVVPEECDSETGTTTAQAEEPLQKDEPVQPEQPRQAIVPPPAVPNFQQFPQSAQEAYLRAMQRARQSQAMANAYANGVATPQGFGSGVGVSVTTGPDGQSKVVESYFGAAAKKEGVSNRTYSLPPTGRGHAVGVDATTDSTGAVHIQRYGQPVR